ncbi:hypothetical protein LC085_15780 [Bacillus tianshenii]|uniref:hypothetical protein n=1 Tax=Sutcliffiella tianshenii TaxID=1463404 RepID=UPI001CD513E7|nr:hypothetical protein [Bacillus tianshenii]MCA1321383.1 hypothetical protein [Bacillus tianshenii]
MNIWQLIQHRIPDGLMNKMEKGTHKLPEKFQAKVTEQLNGALFTVQKGSNSFIAEISGKVETGKEYFFHQIRGERGITLMVDRPLALEENEQTPLSPARSNSKVNPEAAQPVPERLRQVLSEAGVKLPQSDLQQLSRMVEGFKGAQKEMALELTKFLSLKTGTPLDSIVKNLPFLTAALLDDEPLAASLEKVKQLIGVSTDNSPEMVKLKGQLEIMTIPAPLQSQKEMVLFLKTLFSNVGLDYENVLFQRLQSHKSLSSLPLEQLKPLLLQYSKTMRNNEENNAISKLLSKITGFQLLNREEGSFQHLFLPIPVEVKKEPGEWYVHVSSKRKEGEGIDPEYCRIVLYLDLPVFSSTMVDLHVQQKVITLSIHHSYPPLGELVEKGAHRLRENLTGMGYTLSSVKTVPKKEELSLDFVKKILGTSEEGVDLRI